MGNLDDIEELVLATDKVFGGIDIIVNNAANPLMKGVGEITPEAWEKAMNTNLRGPVFSFSMLFRILKRAPEPPLLMFSVTQLICTQPTTYCTP